MEQQIRFCRTGDGANIAYATVGQGPPMVKAANWLSHLEFDWQSPVWRHWLGGLARHHRLIRYDERGCGLSDWDVKEFSLEAWVDDLEAVVEIEGLESFPLLGISRGGPIAITYAARHPEKVSHLILYGSYTRGWQYRELTPAQRQEMEVMYDLIRVGWGKSNPAFRQVFTSLFMPQANVEQVQWLNDLQRVSTSPENAVKMRQASGRINVIDLAPQIQVPTLILHAQNDAVVPFAEGRLLATLIPGARFVPLEGVNHILVEDEPAWPVFLRELYQFLGVSDGPAELPIEGEKTAAASPQPAIGAAGLTLREREVLDLIARGYRNSDIAQALVLSPKTVRNYISIIFSKLAVTSRGEAIVRARQAGFGREES
jgi:pimeloyl-ACP methyl ester carboxylesterase/DNA-binding CsgD family transcriptional regulator